MLYTKKQIVYRKCHFWHVNVYFTNHNLMQRRDPMELNFEGLKMQKIDIPANRV